MQTRIQEIQVIIYHKTESFPASLYYVATNMSNFTIGCPALIQSYCDMQKLIPGKLSTNVRLVLQAFGNQAKS